MYTAHGEYRIEAKGPFNLEIVEQYVKDVESKVNLMMAPWGEIIILHQDSLFTPEAELQLYEVSKGRKELGLTAAAVIFVDSKIAFVIKRQLSEVYRRVGIGHRYFECEVEARAWLSEKLV